MTQSRWETFAHSVATLLNTELESEAIEMLKPALRHYASAANAEHASVIFLGPDRRPLRCVDSSAESGLSVCNELSFDPDDLERIPEEGFFESGPLAKGEVFWTRSIKLPPFPYTAWLFLHRLTDPDRTMIEAYSGLLIPFLKRYCGELPAYPTLVEAMTYAMTELAQPLDREQILDKALSQLAQIVPYDASDVMLRDGPVARVARHTGYDQFDATHVAHTLTIPLETKVFRVMIRTQAPVVIGDTASDPDWVRYEGLDWIRSYIATPIVIEDRVMGFLNLYSRHPGFFTAHHARNLQAFAHYIAVAIQNAKLYERARQRTEESAALNAKLRKREQYLKSLNQLTSALNQTGDADEILQLGLDQALRVTQMDQGAIYLGETQNGTLTLRVRQRLENAPVSPPVPSPKHEAVQRAWNEQKMVIHHRDRDDEDDASRSVIASPLMLAGTAIGVMTLSTNESHTLTRETTDLLRAIADQLAFAAQRGQQASQIRDQLAIVHTLYEISTAFLSQMKISGVTFLLTRTLTDHIPHAAGVALYRQDDRGDWCRMRVYIPDSESPLRSHWQEGETWDGEDLILTLCKQQRRQIFISHHQTQALPILDAMQAEGIQPALAYVPIVLPDRGVWGIVALMLKDGESNQGYATTLLQAILQQGIAALSRATLYEESRAGESRMQAILESSRDGIILMAEDKEIRYINGRALRLLNINASPKNWVGSDLSAFRQALRREAPELYTWLDEDAPSANHTAEIPESEGPPDFETLHNRVLKLQQWPVHSDQGHTLGSLYLLRDITEQRELEHMRDDFLHMLVHDLRNPLSNIQNALRFIADPMMQDMADEIIEIAQTNANRILKLVNTILEIGKLESQQIELEREPVILGQIIERTTQDLMLSQQPFNFEVVIPDETPKIWADPAILVRVLDNLLSNAAKFAPEGGIVRVTVAHQEDVAQISVYNNGPHFGPEVEKRLFQKFSPGDYDLQGYGLGLAFCRLAVEAHGGKINAVNEPEGGVSFIFTLPIYNGQDIAGNVFLSTFDDFDVDL
jgi:signal transduction histidine kinase/GAF domain-containing protein